MMDPSRRSPIGSATMALACVAAAFLLGNLATIPNLPWYATLAKPSFNPPNWVFGPAWTLLYGLMALAFFRILRQPVEARRRRLAILAFLVQLALNAAWSWVFFAAHSPALGMGVIVALLAAITMTAALFAPLDRVAALCFVPYWLWVAFATALNGAILLLNP